MTTTERNQIVLIQENLTALTTGQLTLTDVEINLRTLWEKAEAAGDNGALDAIDTVWNQAQALATVTGQAAALAGTAVEVATEAVKQRDVIADELGKVSKEHNELKEAVESVDTDHPLVQQLYEDVEESVYEYMADLEMEGGIHTSSPGYDIAFMGHLPDVDMDMADQFVYALFNCGESITDELNNEIATFIKAFIPRCRAHWEAEGKRRMAEYEARLAARLAADQAKASGQ